MKITWEDRKQRGSIDDQPLNEKPQLSFEYAWFLVTDETAQFVESHAEGYYNKDMSDEQRQEVIDFYYAWEPPAPEPVPEPVPPPRHITVLAFLSRFTDEEAIAIDLLSIGATVEAATIRRYLSKINAATYVDLDREDVRQGVQSLEASGVLAEGRSVIILDAPIEEIEIPLTLV